MASRKISELTDEELGVMDKLWEAGEADRSDLSMLHGGEHFDRTFDTLVTDGLIVPQADQGQNVYRPAVNQEDGYRTLLKEIADKHFCGSIEKLVQAFANPKGLTDDERAKALRLIKGMD